jgi:anti-anti-sigma regulatory factor
MRLFFIAMKHQKKNGGQASFVNLQPQIKEVFAIMGSMPGVQIFRDEAEMDAYLLARQITHTQQSIRP